MSKQTFHFKQFSVQHQKSAMKVGTDGVLLGAWAKCADQSSNLLDIGTGTGLIALMLAQRFPNLHITAIEADADASDEARENVQKSPFAHQIEIKHQTLQTFSNEGQKFDTIVCNPPFFEGVFESNSARQFARHIQVLPPELLLKLVGQLLSSNGIGNVIYPFELLERVENAMAKQKLYILNQTHVLATTDSKKPERVLISFGKSKKEKEIDQIAIETSRHVYTHEYWQLTKSFYQKMKD